MSHGIVSGGSQFSFHDCNTRTGISSTKKTNLKPNCQTFPLRKSQSGSFRIKPIKASATAITDMSVTTTESFYDLLGISERGTLLEIKKAYKLLARKYHPDVSPPDRTEENTKRFIQVQEAYETLSDPGMRALYDRNIARGLHMAFSAKRKTQNREACYGGCDEWKEQWESQLAELKRRSMNKDLRQNMSWGASVRRQRSQQK